MHRFDLWAGVNSQVTAGRGPHTWMSFRDCLELHKLMVFSADAAKRQWFSIQQAVRKPQRGTVQQHIFITRSRTRWWCTSMSGGADMCIIEQAGLDKW
jgi:hypothetical protein